jgi:hypothetical protein
MMKMHENGDEMMGCEKWIGKMKGMIRNTYLGH